MGVTNPHPWTDDDGTDLTGTVVNNAALQQIYDDLGPNTSTITTTGTQTALAKPGAFNGVIFANNASLLTIQGITAGSDGQRLAILSIGAGRIDLVHQSGSATAANRLVNIATSGITSLAAGSGSAVFQYDATAARWRLILHEQGAWIARTFSAGNFTAVSGGTWTVAAATTDAYWLKGRTLFWASEVSGSISSSPHTLSIAIPFTVQRPMAAVALGVNNTTVLVIEWSVSASGAALLFTNFSGDWATTGAVNVVAIIEVT